MPHLRKPDDHGDLMVKISIQIPKELTPEEQELYEKLASLQSGKQSGL
jgi:DnaJ-class molecular chaperone